MQERYFKEYSNILGREMEFLLVGHGGKLCLAYPSQNGRFFDFKDNGMIECVRGWVDEGKLQFVLCDALDRDSWSAEGADGRRRIENQERWFNYIHDELMPRAYELTGASGKALATGCSLGAVHAANSLFRRPDIFDACISLSGTYDARLFWNGYDDDLVYWNSPARFLLDLPEDDWRMQCYRESRIIICIGQGDWEWELLPGTRELDRVMKSRGIPAWVDYWGYDVCHDWPWWRRQLPYFMNSLGL